MDDGSPGSAIPAGLTYAAAGVDADAGDRAVKLIKELVGSTRRPEVIGDLGGFGGLFALDVADARAPVLVASTDGVGTKAHVARAARRLGTIGIDLVAMCVDDVVCHGAEPLLLLDYISVGKLEPEFVATLVEGVAAGCRQAGCALLGGEMAEHAGVLSASDFDLVGFAVGVVERDRLIDGHRVEPGDALVGLPSPGLRSNGYSLARAILFDRAGLGLDDPAWPGADRSLADELLLPSVIYAPAVVSLFGAVDVHAVAHITGGGLPGNVARALPAGCDAVIDRGTWEQPRIFAELQRLGDVADEEMVRVFNLGIGMVLVVAQDAVVATLEHLAACGLSATVVGRVVPGDRRVQVQW